MYALQRKRIRAGAVCSRIAESGDDDNRMHDLQLLSVRAARVGPQRPKQSLIGILARTTKVLIALAVAVAIALAFGVLLR